MLFYCFKHSEIILVADYQLEFFSIVTKKKQPKSLEQKQTTTKLKSLGLTRELIHIVHGHQRWCGDGLGGVGEGGEGQWGKKGRTFVYFQQ